MPAPRAHCFPSPLPPSPMMTMINFLRTFIIHNINEEEEEEQDDIADVTAVDAVILQTVTHRKINCTKSIIVAAIAT